MQRTRTGLLVSAALVVVVLVAACGGGGGSKEDKAQAEEWAWLTEAKQTLDSKRQEVVDLVYQMEAEVAEVAEEVSEEAGEMADDVGEVVAEVDLGAKLMELEAEVETLTEEFSNRLVAFINADPMIEGEEPTERQMSALRMKSSEDIVLAEEWIVRGGDYKRAIEIVNTAIMFDTDNEELQAALDAFEAKRYMNEEWFAAAEKGMTEDEVRRVLGQVNLHNLREYPDKGVVAWFYPTAEDGSAAAVWFQPEKDSDVLTVYQVKFEAIDPSAMAEQ